MKLSRLMVPGVAALALMVGGCKSDPGATTPTQAGAVTGEVVSARYDGVILKRQEGAERLRLAVDPATQIVVEGRIVMVERLPEGATVRAAYDANGKATRIETLPKAGANGGG